MEHRLNERAPHPSELVFPGAAFPGASEVVRDTYRHLWSATRLTETEIEAREQELKLTTALVADFCDEYLSPRAYTAAMLSPILEAATATSGGTQAWEALRVYANNTTETEEEKRYVIGLASDRPVIADFWRESVATRYTADPTLQSLLQSSEPTEVSIEHWGVHARSIEPRYINELASSVNLESLLIKAGELLAQLDPSTAKNDSQTLDRAHQAEALLAPLCEIIGFDALAMALYSHVHVLRAMFTGNLAPLQQAQNIINERGNKEQVDRDVQELFGVIFGDNIHEQIINHGAEHGIMMGEGYCTGECLRVNWRLKSIGSLTKKLDTRSPENIPLDIIGATVTTQDVPQIALRLKRILERSSSDERVALTPTSERDAAIHVKGTGEYIETIRKGLGFESLEAMREVVDVVEVDAGAHRVCKVTLVFAQPGRPELRAEIQITTESDRVENRIGKAAHMLYKLVKHLGIGAESIDREDYAQDLALIHARKKHLGATSYDQLTSGSLNAAAALYRELTSPVSRAFSAA
jgi:hypothetical protein